MSNGSIMIVGVGGQGTLLAGKILGNVFLLSGYDVKVSEIHGMSQRGGSVVTYIKYGPKVFSPVIDRGEADIIISFELLESLRWMEYLKPEGTIFVNSQKINPMPVITGKATYPEDIAAKLTDAGIDVICDDFARMAKEAGSIKAVNVALLGRASLAFKDIGYDKWIEAIEKSVPWKFLEMNKKAFDLGRGE